MPGGPPAGIPLLAELELLVVEELELLEEELLRLELGPKLNKLLPVCVLLSDELITTEEEIITSSTARPEVISV